MIIDLTHPINSVMPVYPGTIPPRIEQHCNIEKDGFAESGLSMVTHTGTHIDAPCHLFSGAASLDKLPLDRYAGSAFVIRCGNRAELDLDFLNIFSFEIKQTDFVLFCTGWAEKWGSSDYFSDFPVLTPEACRWLASFPLKGIGFDTLSADLVGSQELPNHRILLKKEILIIENLNNLAGIPSICKFQCFPLRIENADGSPVRALAIIE